MSYTEALERLLGELQKLNAKVDSLDVRLRGLEDKGAVAATPSASAASSAEPPAQREGSFGPEVQRSDPTRHQRAVRQALALNGAPAGASSPEESLEACEASEASTARESHQRACRTSPSGIQSSAAAASPATATYPITPTAATPTP